MKAHTPGTHAPDHDPKLPVDDVELPTHHPEVQAAHQAHRTRASDAAPAACPRLASCDAGARISSLMTRPWRKRDSNPRSRLPTSTRTIQLSGCSVHGQYLVAHGVVPPTPFFVTPGMQVQSSLFASGRLRRPKAMTRAAGGNLLALSLASALSVAAQAADEIKSGKWEFTTQMQLPGGQAADSHSLMRGRRPGEPSP